MLGVALNVLFLWLFVTFFSPWYHTGSRLLSLHPGLVPVSDILLRQFPVKFVGRPVNCLFIDPGRRVQSINVSGYGWNKGA
jgi:hypothetical protein